MSTAVKRFHSAMGRHYTVISYDHAGMYCGVVADNLSPELMT